MLDGSLGSALGHKVVTALGVCDGILLSFVLGKALVVQVGVLDGDCERNLVEVLLGSLLCISVGIPVGLVEGCTLGLSLRSPVG